MRPRLHLRLSNFLRSALVLAVVASCALLGFWLDNRYEAEADRWRCISLIVRLGPVAKSDRLLSPPDATTLSANDLELIEKDLGFSYSDYDLDARATVDRCWNAVSFSQLTDFTGKPLPKGAYNGGEPKLFWQWLAWALYGSSAVLGLCWLWYFILARLGEISDAIRQTP